MSGDGTHSIVVLIQIIGNHGFVPRQRLFKIGKRIARNPKRGGFDIMRKFVKPALVRDVLRASWPDHTH